MDIIVNKIMRGFELVIVSLLMAVLMVVILYSCFILVDALYDRLITVDFKAELAEDPQVIQAGLYRVFGNLLTVLLGLELIHTIKIFFAENRIKLESIIVISVIAIARHLITLDYHHTDGMVLVGLALILAVFLGAYILMYKFRITYHDEIDKLKKASSGSRDGIPVLTEKENL